MKFGLSDAISQLDGARFQKLLDDLKRTRINFTLPKFKITKEFDLKSAAEQLGIKTAFKDEADFEKMANELKVSNGRHKAVIEVDEIGTVAAAATGAFMFPTCYVRSIEFTPNHPFLFALLKNKHPIFLGVFNGV